MRRRKAQKSKQAQMIFGRFSLIVGLWVIWMGVISVQLVHMQVNQHEELVRRALVQRRKNIKEKELRGTIFDRDGNRLAVSVDVESMFIDPDKIRNIESMAAQLAPIMKEKAGAIIARIKKVKESGRKHVRF